jgi:hypothetical protein
MTEGDGVAARALARRQRGDSWEAIAASIGLPAGALAEMVADLLCADPAITHEAEVRLDLARLDELLRSVWTAANDTGDMQAVGQALKILDRRAELLAAVGVAPGAAGGKGERMDSPDGPPVESEAPAAYLARVRRAAAGSTGGPALSLVEDPDDDDDD